MKVYNVEIGGVVHTMRLSDEDAKLRGLSSSDEAKAPEKKAAAKPANKARTAKNKSV